MRDSILLRLSLVSAIVSMPLGSLLAEDVSLLDDSTTIANNALNEAGVVSGDENASNPLAVVNSVDFRAQFFDLGGAQ